MAIEKNKQERREPRSTSIEIAMVYQVVKAS